jgi:hypothetical protein
LRWTFGAMRGREEGNWQKIVALLEPDKLVAVLRASGFSGIVINRNGYTDQAASIEQALSDLGLKLEVTSPDNTLTMYSFDSAAAADMALAAAPGQGWYGIETHDSGPRIWSRGDAEIMLSNVASARTQCRISLALRTLVPRKVWLMDGTQTLAELALQPGVLAHLVSDIHVDPGKEKRLVVRTDVPAQLPGNGDPRLLAFYWETESTPLCQ